VHAAQLAFSASPEPRAATFLALAVSQRASRKVSTQPPRG
jgi:hypothetical protein